MIYYDFILNPEYEKGMKLICQEALSRGFDSVEFRTSKAADSGYLYFYDQTKLKYQSHGENSYGLFELPSKKSISEKVAIDKGLLFIVRISNHLPAYERFDVAVSMNNDSYTIFEKIQKFIKE